jgi:ribonucleoside-diphosphate reductase alpha chain
VPSAPSFFSRIKKAYIAATLSANVKNTDDIIANSFPETVILRIPSKNSGSEITARSSNDTIMNLDNIEIEVKHMKFVTKNDGSKEAQNLDKLHKFAEFACEGVEGVSPSELEMEISQHLYDGIPTKEINEQFVSACKSLMSAGKYHYDKVGGKALSYIVRKEAYGEFKSPKLFDIVSRNVAIGRYDPDIPTMYTAEEWEQLDAMIDHSRDELFRLAGAEQMRIKYLSKNRVTKQIYESFQIPFILVPVVLFRNEKNRMVEIKKAYDNLSLFDISQPSPIMSGVRTILKQFSSCVLIDVDDTIDSIGASHHAILKYVSNKAGLGVNVGRNRGLGAPIKGGEAIHTGVIGFIKDLTAGTKSCSQGGMRDGAVTFNFPIWHYEAPELILLKDSTLPVEQTNRQADYCVQFNRFIYKRVKDNKDISLFSPYETPGLYEAFFSDQAKFEYLYEKYEADLSIRRRTMSAQKLFNDFVTQRSNTGRMYFSNVDTVNERSSFKVPIYMTNLCVEITLPTTPLDDIKAGFPSEISICTLGAINWGKINKPSDFEEPCRMAVRIADAVLDYQDYPVEAARQSTMARRPIGIGIIGFAHFLAKKGLPYDRISLGLIDEFAEAWSYYLIKASVDLAKEKGPCPLWKETKYSDGWFPHMTRAAGLDKILPHKTRMPWNELRADLLKYGIRNSTLMAGMPSETSSQLSNETNGFEKAMGPVIVKPSKDAAPPIAVPEVDELMYAYDWLWESKSPRGYLEVTAVFQKHMDQGMSINFSYNPKFFKDEKLDTETLGKDIMYAYSLGHKNGYYQNTKKPGESDILGFVEDTSAAGCEGGACHI